MKFEFAKFTEVTDFAFRVNTEYKESGYTRIFICSDTNDFWLARVLKNYGEDYEEIEGSYILEREKIPKENKGQSLTISRTRQILKEDTFENWEYFVFDNIEDVIDRIDGGFGINNLEK
jgi:hypothetical protein